MIAFLIPVFIVIVITIFSADGGNIFKSIGDSFSNLRPYFFVTKAPDQKGQKQTPAPSAFQKPPTPAPPLFSLDTAIVTGPKEKESIADTKATFEFSGSVDPPQPQGSITFESKVQGVDSDWVASSSTRTITLPAGLKEYTLFVRSKLNNVVDQTPAARTFRVNVSPYFGKVTISSMSTGTPSLITLRANLKQGEEVSLTGWKVKGRAGEFTIGKGIERVGPSLTLVAQDNMTMKSPDTVYLSSARGPFGFQKHFRPNSCMGFLNSSFVFPIAVPSSCNVEKPTEEYLFSLSLLKACEDFILQKVNYSSCAMTDYFNDVLVRSDSQCVSYLSQLAKEFTYEGCYYNKESKPDFLKTEWHIYTGINLPSQKFDEIKLLDQNDLLIDQKKYSL